MSERRAFITGVAGQDGSYLAELLLEKGYKVFGLVHYSTTAGKLANIENVKDKIEVIHGDITDNVMMEREIKRIKPHEVYNLASQSHVGRSFEMPDLTARVTGLSVLNLLEAIRSSGFNSKFYQASTSELFGNATDGFQDENSPLVPVSPYGCAKLFAHHITRTYREAYNMFACSGILFNHESPRRGPEFVTQKIATAVVRVALGKQNVIKLGNLDARRDWGHARDYVKGMHLMLQQPAPDDFVLATGETHTIREFLDIACEEAEIKPNIKIDPTLYRPVDVNVLRGNPDKAKNVLGWKPEIKFRNLVVEMVDDAYRRENT